jgi:hypothetical protein
MDGRSLASPDRFSENVRVLAGCSFFGLSMLFHRLGSFSALWSWTIEALTAFSGESTGGIWRTAKYRRFVLPSMGEDQA